MSKIKEEGDICGIDNCQGHLIFGKVDNCSCHIVAPCGACTDQKLSCSECLEEYIIMQDKNNKIIELGARVKNQDGLYGKVVSFDVTCQYVEVLCEGTMTRRAWGAERVMVCDE